MVKTQKGMERMDERPGWGCHQGFANWAPLTRQVALDQTILGLTQRSI